MAGKAEWRRIMASNAETRTIRNLPGDNITFDGLLTMAEAESDETARLTEIALHLPNGS